MIRALNKHLGIPAEVLIQEAGGVIPDDVKGSSGRSSLSWRWQRKAHQSKSKRQRPRRADHARPHRARRRFSEPVPRCRKSDGARRNAKMDSYALMAWCTYVLGEAHANKPKPNTRKGHHDRIPSRNRPAQRIGKRPKRAQKFLAKHGIILIVAPHLANTYLDGAAMLMKDGTPVVRMTVRYDRLDNFWFCLLHELTHVARHLSEKGERFSSMIWI